MSSYIFETVEFRNQYPVNAFVTSIQSSSYHWHYEYELIVVLKGSIMINMNPRPITLHEKDIVLVNSKIVHEIKNTEEENLCVILQLAPTLFQKEQGDSTYYRFYLNSVLQELSIKQSYEYFVRRVAKIGLCTLQKDADAKKSYRLRAEVYTLIADLFDYVEYDMCMKVQQFDEDATLLIQIIDYLNQHMNEKEVVENLCKEVGMSNKTIHRYLKENIGVSAKDMLDSLKIDKAKKLLRNTEKKMNYIVDECGFGSENTFYRIFKHHTSQTPKEYRQRGIDIENRTIVKGYLDFEENEASRILLDILEEK